VLAHGAGYVAGVLATMLALAAVVIALRAAGTAVGWGFQFQEPAYSLAIASLLVVLALNLFGVFEVAAPAGLAYVGASASGAGRSFCDGLLAVALATPCSAPFLGTAVGFAFASPPPVTLAIFAALGLGSLPLAWSR
jgi:thiol:disulfide interchange protein DsbD